jgi:hypothetical protein
MLGKLNALEPALGKAIFVGTRLATIAVVIATDISDGAKSHGNPWESILKLDEETMVALNEVGQNLDRWNRHPIRTLHTWIAVSSILPLEATASLDRKIPARRIHDRRAVMASNASDFAVASYFRGAARVLLFGRAERHRKSRIIVCEGVIGHREDARLHGYVREVGALRVDTFMVAYR